jgi:hypothetical protein
MAKNGEGKELTDPKSSARVSVYLAFNGPTQAVPAASGITVPALLRLWFCLGAWGPLHDANPFDSPMKNPLSLARGFSLLVRVALDRDGEAALWGGSLRNPGVQNRFLLVAKAGWRLAALIETTLTPAGK